MGAAARQGADVNKQSAVNDCALESPVRRARRRSVLAATGSPINRDWLSLHYPPTGIYDVLHGLLILVRLGHAADHRLRDAVAILENQRSGDGTWGPGGCWWKPPGSGRDASRGLKA